MDTELNPHEKAILAGQRAVIIISSVIITLTLIIAGSFIVAMTCYSTPPNVEGK